MVGDIAFTGSLADRVDAGVFSKISGHFLASNLVIGNLESPLTDIGEPAKGKCTLRASTRWANILNKSGIHIVSLANNHLMDFGEDGLFSTIDVLDAAEIRHVGAGSNAEKANTPLILTVSGRRISLIARSSVPVASRCYAERDGAGVAWLDVDETIETLRKCKSRSDFVILLVHWGLENYSYPTPNQRALATTFVQAGADAVIGHHPHVLQGVERTGEGIVAYSLGNFLFDDFEWSFVGRDGNTHDRVIKMSEKNRQSGILDIVLQKNGASRYEFHPTRTEPGGMVLVDDEVQRRRDFERLSARLGRPGYAVFWRLYSLMREWDLRMKPMIRGKLTLENLRKLRIRHFKELFDVTKRSSKVMSGKTTNPYE
jgi:poly-gamma-glutamate synthesis protein (capsule biosynthesis protein)